MFVSSMLNLGIDLGALEHNYRQLRGLCEPQVKMLAVVKADAYGHGLLPVARTLARAGADYLGVGSLDEGLTLRQAGLTLPILLLLGILPQEAERTVAADLEVALFRRDVAEALAAAARSQMKKAKVHLKVDTGMGRLGLLPGEVPEFLAGLKDYRQLEVLGLISHLAVADLEDKTYTLRQLQDFTDLLAAVRGQGWALPLSHISNSAALWEHQEAHLGLVRPGLMLYGSPPAPDRPPPVELKPVMSLTTQVLQLKHLPPGSSISYGCTYTTPDGLRPGGAAGGLLQRLQPAAVQPGRGPDPGPTRPHPGPGLHEPHHGGGDRHRGRQRGGPGHLAGAGRGRPHQRRRAGGLGRHHQLRSLLHAGRGQPAALPGKIGTLPIFINQAGR